jgi:hypothetical protein
MVSAQDRNHDSEVHAVIRFLAWENEDTKLNLTLRSGEEQVVENLDCFDMTTPLTYQGPAAMLFSSGPMDSDGKNVFALRVNPEWKKILVLVGVDAKHPSGMRMMALDHSTRSFPWGSYRIINTTGKALKMRLGSKLLAIPKTRKSLTVKLNQKSGMIKMIATLAGSTTPFFGCISEHRQDTRKILIFSRQSDRRLGPLALRIIPERKAD